MGYFRAQSSRFQAMILGLLMGLGIASSDLYVSALPNFSKALHMSELASSATVAFFLLMTAMGTIFFLLLRLFLTLKTINLLALCVFAAASLLFFVFEGFVGLLACRITQGIAYGIIQALSLCVAKLLFHEEKEKQFATIGLVAELTCMLAPLSGYFLLKIFGWQSPFFFISIIALFLCVFTKRIFKNVDESIDEIGEKPTFTFLVNHKSYFGWTAITSLQSGLAWGIICLTPFVLKTHGRSDFFLCLSYTGYSLVYAASCFVVDRAILKGSTVLKFLPAAFSAVVFGLFIGFWSDIGWLCAFWLYGFFVGSSYGIVMARTTENISEKYSSQLGFFTSFARLLASGMFVLISAFLFSIKPIFAIISVSIFVLGTGVFVFVLNKHHKKSFGMEEPEPFPIPMKKAGNM